MLELTIVVQDGFVIEVLSSDPLYEGVEVTIVDYDIDGIEPQQLRSIRKTDGQINNAVVSGTHIEMSHIQIV